MRFSDPLILINTFLSKVGMASQSFDENNAMPLSFDSILIGVHKDDDRKMIFVTSVIGKLDAEADQKEPNDSKDFYNRVLESNLTNTLMGAGVVGLNQDSGIIVYGNSVSLMDLTQNAFEAFLERTVNAIEDWHNIAKQEVTSLALKNEMNESSEADFIKI